MEINISRLQNLPLFENIDAEGIAILTERLGAKVKMFQKSEFIFLEGDKLDQVGVLLSGSVYMINEDIWGNKTILSSVSSGDLFGESFACARYDRSSVSFQAMSACEVLLFPFQELDQTCDQPCTFHHQMVSNMARIVAEKNVQMLYKMEILSKKTIRERILAWLSLQSRIHDGKALVSPMGRTELAQFLCVDRSAMSRELARMKKDGLIDLNRTTFYLKEPKS